MEFQTRAAEFISAQDAVWSNVLAELRSGKKRTHWMWFVFPQLAGLGRSATAKHFAIQSLDEAEKYLGHEILGPRLQECTEIVLGHTPRSADDIFGFPDHLKFRSCMTLFAEASGQTEPFKRALDVLFDGEPDSRTLDLIRLG